jgi:hypothetical protein
MNYLGGAPAEQAIHDEVAAQRAAHCREQRRSTRSQHLARRTGWAYFWRFFRHLCTCRE